MKHRPRSPGHADPTRPRLVDMIDTRHELVRLAALIDWSWFEEHWAGLFPSPEGRPALHPRLVAGLMCLQHAHGLSDEAVLARWVENPVLPALHRRGVLPAPTTYSPLLAQPLARPDRRRGRGVAADQDGRGRPGLGCREAAWPVPGYGGHHSHGKGHCPPDRQPALRDGPSLFGDAGPEGRGPAATELQSQGPAPRGPGRASRPCPAVPAHAQGAAHPEGLHGTRPARHRPQARHCPPRGNSGAGSRRAWHSSPACCGRC